MDETLAKLLIRIKDGDDDSFLLLCMRYSPLLDSMLRKYAGEKSSEYEDYRQEAEIALYDAAISFDVFQEKVTFGLYAGICIKNRLISLVRREKKGISGFVSRENSDEGFKSSYDSIYASQEDPASAAVTSEMYRMIIMRIIPELTEYERTVFDLYLEGYSVSEISERARHKRKSVENAICRIRSKLRKLYHSQ